MLGQERYRQWAYKKAARALDGLEDNIEQIYQNKGRTGLLQIKGIGKSLASQIEEFLQTPLQNRQILF